MAPPTQTSRPGRYLAVLAALLIVLVAVAIGTNLTSPGDWHKSFKVGLGLDLSSGTTVTLQAVPPKKGATPSQADMNEAISIMNQRVDGAGFSGSSVVQQGKDIINVSVPGKGSQQVDNLVGTTALLRLRQVLLCSGEGTQCVPQQDLTPSSTASPSASPSASSTAKASASPSASAKASPSAKTSSGSSGSGQAAAARRLPAVGASAKPAASSSAAASAPASPAPSASSPVTSTTAGDASKVEPSVLKLFNKLNCADKNWQSQIYGDNSAAWDDVNSQIVSCGTGSFSGIKYVLDKAKVTGGELKSPAAVLDSSNNEWVVTFNLNGQGSAAFGTLTSSMYDTYSNSGTPTSVLDDFAIVLDGKVIEAPYVQQPITGGQSQISGNFTEASANYLANVLKYGALPLSFKIQQSSSVSPALGSAQLSAGIIAGALGLLLVVIYSFLYYRGLAVVSVLSLAIAAALTYLAVVLLSKYENFTLTLAGVAGLIVAIGITADSFVVFFERLRDEVREGRSLRAAVERGWVRARRTILVSDTVSFLAAALLYYFAIGQVQGFAFTLGLTTVIDIVVVFLFTKPMVTLLARTKFYGQGHRLSGLDAARLGARSPWRGARRPASTTPGTPKEA